MLRKWSLMSGGFSSSLITNNPLQPEHDCQSLNIPPTYFIAPIDSPDPPPSSTLNPATTPPNRRRKLNVSLFSCLPNQKRINRLPALLPYLQRQTLITKTKILPNCHSMKPEPTCSKTQQPSPNRQNFRV
jgi:hypothetical protein